MNITEAPTIENMKTFMVFSGLASEDNFMFDGNFEQFTDTFFSDVSWEAITHWAEKEGYTLAIEGSEVYKEILSILENEDLRLVGDEFYNADGTTTEHGLFDINYRDTVEEYVGYADDIHDETAYE